MPNPSQIAALEQRYGCVEASACEACILLVHTAKDVVNAFCCHLASHEMSQGRFIVLMMLHREPEKRFTPSQLAELCSVTKATMTGLADGLAREGLVERHPDPEDRRSTLVGLSKKGMALLDEILPPHFARVSALMAGLTADERKTLVHLLGKVREGVTRVDALNAGAKCACEGSTAA